MDPLHRILSVYRKTRRLSFFSARFIGMRHSCLDNTSVYIKTMYARVRRKRLSLSVDEKYIYMYRRVICLTWKAARRRHLRRHTRWCEGNPKRYRLSRTCLYSLSLCKGYIQRAGHLFSDMRGIGFRVVAKEGCGRGEEVFDAWLTRLMFHQWRNLSIFSICFFIHHYKKMFYALILVERDQIVSLSFSLSISLPPWKNRGLNLDRAFSYIVRQI